MRGKIEADPIINGVVRYHAGRYRNNGLVV